MGRHRDGRLVGEIAAYASWADTADRTARTKPGRDKFLQRFEDQVDPERALPEAERLRRAEFDRKSYFRSLALKSAKSRRKKESLGNAIPEPGGDGDATGALQPDAEAEAG